MSGSNLEDQRRDIIYHENIDHKVNTLFWRNTIGSLMRLLYPARVRDVYVRLSPPHVGLIQPVVSRHLKIMKDCGLVRDRKNGTRRLCSITEPKIFEIIDAATPELLDLLSKRIIEQIAR